MLLPHQRHTDTTFIKLLNYNASSIHLLLISLFLNKALPVPEHHTVLTNEAPFKGCHYYSYLNYSKEESIRYASLPFLNLPHLLNAETHKTRSMNPFQRR